MKNRGWEWGWFQPTIPLSHSHSYTHYIGCEHWDMQPSWGRQLQSYILLSPLPPPLPASQAGQTSPAPVHTRTE